MTSTQPVNGHSLGADLTAGTSENTAEAKKPFRLFGRQAEALPETDEVAELAAEADRLSKLDRIEQENAQLFATVRDADERQADHDVDRQIRARQRSSRLALGIARAEREERIAKTTAALDAEDELEKIDERKALRKRRKLTNPNAALAQAYRKWRQYSLVLAGMSLVGISFASWAVARGLGGSSPEPLFYAFDPLLSVPLLIIVLIQSFAAQHGRLALVAPITTKKTSWGETRRLSAIGWIESGLLLGSMGMSAFGAVRHGDFGSPLFAAMVIAPVLVVISISLQYVLAKLFGSIIAELQLDGQVDEDNARKVAVTANLLVPSVRERIKRGEFRLLDDGLPSTQEIRVAINRSKVVAQVIRDILAEPQKGGE